VGQVSQPANGGKEMAGRLETCPTAISLGEAPLSAIVLLAALAMAGATLAFQVFFGDPKPVEFLEGFTGGSFDRRKWMLIPQSPPGVQFDLSGDSLHIIVPPGPSGRPAASFRANFQIEGDFELRMDYQIGSLPKPKNEWVNVEIFVDGTDGFAAVIRTNHAAQGHGYTMWFDPRDKAKAQGVWKHVPTSDQSGTLRLQRLGSEVHYWAAAPAKDLNRIGSVAFGSGPIHHIEFRVIAPKLESPVELTLDSIAVKADRLIERERPATSRFGPRSWIGGVAVVGGSAMATLVWFWYRRVMA
jgi:hypothetical protein